MNNTGVVVHTDNSALAVSGYVPVAGLDELSPDDFSIPAIKLVQAQTREAGADEHLGQYLRTDTKQFIKAPKLLILGIAKSRIMFDKPYDPDKPPLCKSDNANYPRPEFVSTYVGDTLIPDNCNKDCPFAKWGKNNERPACDLVDNWAALTEDGDPVIIRLSGASAKVSTQLKNLARAAALKHSPLYVQLGSLKVEGATRYYIPVVNVLNEAVPENILNIAENLTGLNLAARGAAQDSAPSGEQQRSSTPPPPDDPFSGEENNIPF